MNAKEFVNYFKGGIELGKLQELNEENFNLVIKKLTKVKNEDSQEGKFCTWLQGVLETSDENKVSEKKMLLIKEKLNSFLEPEVVHQNQSDFGGSSIFTERC